MIITDTPVQQRCRECGGWIIWVQVGAVWCSTCLCILRKEAAREAAPQIDAE